MRIPDAEIAPGLVFQRIVILIVKFPPPFNLIGVWAFYQATIGVYPRMGEEAFSIFCSKTAAGIGKAY